jgi:hypothetical protein
MATFITIAMMGHHRWLQAVQFMVTRRQYPLEHIITGRYTLDTITEALKGMAAFEEAKPVVSPFPPA